MSPSARARQGQKESTSGATPKTSQIRGEQQEGMLEGRRYQ